MRESAPMASGEHHEYKNRARLGLAVGLCLLLLTALAAGLTIYRLNRITNRVAHSMDIDSALSDLETNLDDVGRARAGYMASGDQASYEQYQAAAAQTQQRLERVRELLANFPEHKHSFEQVQVLTGRRLAINAQAVEARRAGQSPSLADVTAQLVAVGNDLSGLLREMESHEEAFTRERKTTSDRLFFVTQFILAWAFAISIGLLYWNFRLLRMDLAERQRGESALRESRDSLRALSTRLMQVQDEERRRLSRELHDSLGQSLVLAKMNISSLSDHAIPDGVLDESLKYLDQSIAETRTISYLLHPPLLDDIGFASAAEWLVEGFAERSSIQAEIHIPKRPPRLPHSFELTLFRVLQECLTNIHRHSKASRADVSFSVSDREAILTVRDYGKGMTGNVLSKVKTGDHHGGVGLAGMRERVLEQGGVMEIFSDGTGTAVVVRIPLAELAAQDHYAVPSPPPA
jgi:signal transduction histidine kinase